MGQIFRTSPLFPTVTKSLPPPFIWLGQYLNTTTTNYPIKGWCVYHFGLVNTWRNGNICTIGFLPHHDEIGESCSFVCFVQYQFMVGYFRYLVERRLVVSQINQSFLLSPTTSSENNAQPSRHKKWIKMFLFQNSHSCISPPILDVSQNQYFAHRLHIPRSQEIWSVKIHIWGKNIKFVQRFSEKVFANNYRIHTVSLGSLTFYNSFNLSYSLLRGRAKVTCNSSRLGERKIIGIIYLDLICSTCT